MIDNKRYITLTQDEVKELLKDKKAILLDVRTDDEYREKHVDESVNIPIDELEERFYELDEDKTYIVFCAHGVRSAAGTCILLEKGLTNIYNSQEGIATWK
ncbi:MAG: rhodanese-like domain-containing protein [Cetobacterium sp.]|uniref:rhodanese-like domain-containing protein n=1 Tax=Cetobacterium sp. TaxID=2071632 RepID=UPI002FC70364